MKKSLIINPELLWDENVDHFICKEKFWILFALMTTLVFQNKAERKLERVKFAELFHGVNIQDVAGIREI